MPLSPVIDSAIPKQNFELVRDQIGGILLCEFANQASLYALPAECTPSAVDIERFTQIDEDEFPRMVVRLDKGSYMAGEEQTRDSSGQRRGTYKYYIDTYTGSATIGGSPGDNLATVALHRMIGVAMAILEDTRYATLGFDPKTSGVVVENLHVQDFFIPMPSPTENSGDYIRGRICLSVTVPEVVALPQPWELKEVNATVKLFESDKGFYWQLLQKQISIVATGPTLTDVFFSNPIAEIVISITLQTYKAGIDFSQSGTTITAISFEFTASQIITART